MLGPAPIPPPPGAPPPPHTLPNLLHPGCIASLKRYPNAAVSAPLANLPPPATEANPPSTDVATSLTSKLRPRSRGPANEPTAPARAPGPHLPPEATAEPQPTGACPAMFIRCVSEPNAS